MSFSLNTLLAILIALSSFVVVPETTTAIAEDNSISIMDRWEADDISPSPFRADREINVIAQNFIPIVTIALLGESAPNFQFYLPLYKLQQEKDYFLII